MASKQLITLCFVLAALVLISSHAAVAARELAGKKTEELQKRDPIEESKACPYGCQLFWKGHCWVCKAKPRPPAAVVPAHANAAAAGRTSGGGEEAHAKADPQN